MLACTGIFVTEAGFRWPGYLSKSLDLKFEDVPGGALDSYAAVPALGWLQIVAFIIILELGYGATPPGNAPGDVGGPTWIRYDDPEVGRCRAPRGASEGKPPAAARGGGLPRTAPPLPPRPTRPSLFRRMHHRARFGAPARRLRARATPCARVAPHHGSRRDAGTTTSASSGSSDPARAPAQVKKFKLNVERNNGRAAMMGITGMMIHNLVGVDSLCAAIPAQAIRPCEVASERIAGRGQVPNCAVGLPHDAAPEGGEHPRVIHAWRRLVAALLKISRAVGARRSRAPRGNRQSVRHSHIITAHRACSICFSPPTDSRPGRHRPASQAATLAARWRKAQLAVPPKEMWNVEGAEDAAAVLDKRKFPGGSA